MRSASLFRSLVLALLFCCIRARGAADPFSSDSVKSPPEASIHDREMFQRTAREVEERFRKRVSIPDAVGEGAVVAVAGRPYGARASKAPAPPPPSLPAVLSVQNLLFAALFLLSGILAARKFGPQIMDSINTRHDPWTFSAAASRGFALKVRSEEEAFSEFLAAFQVGPGSAPNHSTGGPGASAAGEAGNAAAGTERRSIEEFLAKSPELLIALHKRYEETCRAPGASARQKTLSDLCSLIGDLKGLAGFEELRPAWQMACALEGLVKQLAQKTRDITPSTLRTLGGGLDLLHELCVEGLDSNLLTNPPFRLLAVDDDSISRHAVSCAVRKAFNQPDLAENGESALVLASENSYDVIFLDVQMPGMDGFELCSKIHATECNRATPVVFVTCQSDFNARAESTLCGGNDLIAKPFLTFEITLKALTLAVHHRLDKRQQLAKASAEPAAADGVLESIPEPVGVLVSGLRGWALGQPCGDRALPALSARWSPDAGDADSQDLDAVVDAFFARAPEHLEALREFAEQTNRNSDPDARRAMLEDLVFRVHSLTRSAHLARLAPISQVGAALEGLLKRLLEKPGNPASSFRTMASAVGLLQDLCANEVKINLAANPPIRILVVDDDLIARRAMGVALQMFFEKPDLAGNGEDALLLAEDRPYDVIFLDVLMPGLDGFAVCSRIHETSANCRTPVVLVTSWIEPGLQAECESCGGSEIATKPLVNAEVTVKALTYALRHRFEKLVARTPEHALHAGQPG